MTLPTPGTFRTGRVWRKVATDSGGITSWPSGLFTSDATFARNLHGATPAEAVRCSSARISPRMDSAIHVADGVPTRFSVTSR